MFDTTDPTKKWHTDSILFKMTIITTIILVLLIPSNWIQDLVVERDGYHQRIMDQVAQKWSGDQLIQGPVLTIPYRKQITEMDGNNKMVTHDVVQKAYLLPQVLKIKAALKTELFQQGITDVAVYNAKVLLQGNFDLADFEKLGIDPATIQYEKASFIFGLSDFKALKNNPVAVIQGRTYNTENVYDNDNPFGKALQAHFTMPKNGSITFTYFLDLKGSNSFKFLQTGKETDAEISSDWKSPVFDGNSLPDNRSITKDGFTANWHMLNYNRPFPQQWLGNDTTLTSKKAMNDATSGVELRLPVDQYRKVMRTTKYATLIIILTFVSLFFTELIRKQNIHLFNYTLIGAAIMVYYTLLLSFAEQMGYNLAYLIASAATIGLISAFTASLLNNRNAAILFAFILTLFYSFIYVIIQLEDLSLMIGSIALFLIIAALMYFSRKINWDKH
jgi:inner membrane protein